MNLAKRIWLESGSRTTPEYQAVLDRATALGYTAPSASVQLAQNQLVSDLKNAGIWTELDIFYVFTSGSNNFARINWISPSSNLCTLVNTPTWTDGVGFNGNGTTQYINTNWIPSDGPNFTQNDASLFAYISSAVSEAKSDLGVAPTFLGGSNITRIVVDDAFNNYLVSINQSGSMSFARAGSSIPSMIGLWHVQRKDASNNYLFYEGSQKRTEADASSGLSTMALFVLAYNAGGAAGQFSTRKVSIVGAGASLNGLESSLNTCITTYRTAIGL